MPPNDDPKSEQLSESIDAAIERKVSERLRELQEQLDRRVQETIRDDRVFVKDTIGLAFKVAGFAVAVVVVVLGALGLKTYFDFHKTTIDTATKVAKEITEDHFKGPDGKRITESVLDQTVLNSYLVRIALLDADNARWAPRIKIAQRNMGPTRFKIAEPDVDRLLGIIKSDDTTATDFESAAYVLLRGNVPTSDVAKILKSFITAKGKDEEWRNANKEKRRWLLNTLKESPFSADEVKAACEELISSDDKNEFKLPAIAYLGATKDHDALEKLVELAEKGKEEKGQDLGDEAVLAVAKIDPKNEVVKNWIADPNTISDPSAKKIARALEISDALIDNGEALDIPLKLVEFAASHSQLSIYENKPAPDNILVRSATDPRKRMSIPAALLFDEKDGWTKTVDELLRKSAQEPDLKDFRRFVRWLAIKGAYPGARSPVASVKLVIPPSSNSKIIFMDGGEVDKQSAPGGVVLAPGDETKDGKPSEQIKVVWTDAEKQQRSGILTKLENAKDLRFRREMSPLLGQ